MVLHPYDRIIVCGKTQSGKTTFVKEYIIPFLDNYIVYDPDLHFSRCGVVVTSIEALEGVLSNKHTKIVYQPTIAEVKSFELRVENFEKICSILNYKLRNFTFVIDEIRWVTRPTGSNHTRMPPEFGLMVMRRMKAPYRIGIICTTQRLKDSDVDLISQVQHVITFKIEMTDIKYIQDHVNVKIKQLITKLKTFGFLHYDSIKGTVSVNSPVTLGAGHKWDNRF